MIIEGLPLEGLLSPMVSKKVEFLNSTSLYGHRVAGAVSVGLPLTHEVYTLVYPALTDAQLRMVEVVLEKTTVDARIAWTPPCEHTPRLFRPPVSWKSQRVRLEQPRGTDTGVYTPSVYPYPQTAMRTRVEFTLETHVLAAKVEALHWDMIGKFYDTGLEWDGMTGTDWN